MDTWLPVMDLQWHIENVGLSSRFIQKWTEASPKDGKVGGLLVILQESLFFFFSFICLFVCLFRNGSHCLALATLGLSL